MILPKLSDDLEKEIVHSIIDTVGRSVTIMSVATRTACPTCNGNDPFCPTCNGNGTVDSTTSYEVVCSVRWKSSDNKVYSPNGQVPEGDCTLVIPITSSGGIIPTNSMLERAAKVTVDGKTCVIDKWYFKGSPINRVYVVLKQDENATQRIG